ncbi:MAG: citrate (Si)-synthase [Candidatus Raymondbacteria bacterium RifOxyC12_full_50_8]|uniref:Citrate synthase n=1 Tax=Candidatus Raymondbacteria bacterium RIFOXYD12_FULL_49_13 TaxID=1817890 RepID=A0A1F7FG07_UNCRA|nr:MAG: citrate (Si)-synthase [Candidatus Raymondbacteria bacterium RIFOXYA2_FULL_49_16]OGJ94610.1 MAG: citrate (Si)-synthase [Candidatus Raymondbacteria bacterium RifOxyB12_full_50_8]OGJ98880.1 MAG: citrate (Si)-synthase [Candidatus Raymondbacteria bacterium RifOxyC12_full_50_8]OGK05402.1 MAG: citrate (Si)-synthase [Candidatus Raymondbacteria bacterium RIFOXYD12_FULL_49_13]OGP43015.1 MAG: citrate (Si)-synthase [Candidatus Raymondbacteria bacterium RIFOXYB2_FULL_49_35]
MSEKAVLTLPGKRIELPLFEGSEGERAIDIGALRKEAGCITFDNGFSNTASCLSDICFIDGEKGILRYRGYDIEDIAAHCTFVEVAYLLVHGKLPTEPELKTFSEYLNEHSMIHEDMQNFFNGMPPQSHPMAILSSMVTSLSSFYPHIMDADPNFDITAARLISKVRTIAAFSYKKSRGEPVVYPRHDLPYCANFLNMMFQSPVKQYEIRPEVVEALNKLLILHADHEQNCSTSTVRMVASSGANLYAAMSAGVSALWGPYHGGANQAVIEMLNEIINDNMNIKKYIAKAKDKNDKFRLMGFGHAVYKNFDPRSKFIKGVCDNLLAKMKIIDPLLDVAKQLEEAALSDSYFIERKLYPNVDFYSGIIYRAIGIPTNMLTVMFAIGRLPGWIAHWKETVDNKHWKIWRPRQVYVGPARRDFIPMNKRA